VVGKEIINIQAVREAAAICPRPL